MPTIPEIKERLQKVVEQSKKLEEAKKPKPASK